MGARGPVLSLPLQRFLHADRAAARRQARGAGSLHRRVRAAAQRVLGAGIEFEISGRAKHIYSIWRKMQRKGIGFSQVYDIRAVRILVPEVKDCYATLGLVHGLWRNIPNEFDDYIANPKENGYRSLHTAVIGPGGQDSRGADPHPAMHEEAELGVCAHWRYKGSDAQRGRAPATRRRSAGCARCSTGTRRPAMPGRRRAAQLRGGSGSGLRVHPPGRCGQPGQRRHAAGFCLPRAHGGRAPLSRRQGQRADRAAHTHAADRRPRGDTHRQARRSRGATGCSPGLATCVHIPGPGQGAGLVSQPGPGGKHRCGTSAAGARVPAPRADQRRLQAHRRAVSFPRSTTCTRP
jgi:hypothetical protein